MTTSITFRTILVQAEGMNATGLTLSEDQVAALGQGKRPKVVVTINGESIRSTVAVMGGAFKVAIPQEFRARAGIEGGQEIAVTLTLDEAPREVDVPEDFAEALAAAGVRETFDRLAFTHRKEHVRAIEDAKKPETRQKRIEKAVEMVRAKAK